EGAPDPALVGLGHVAGDGELAQRHAVGGALVEVDVEVDLVARAPAGEPDRGLAAQITLVEQVALEAVDLVELPLVAGGVARLAHRRARVLDAQPPRRDAAAVGERARPGVDADLALDLALRQRQVAVHADAADALARVDLDRELVDVVGDEGGAVAELLELGADGLGQQVARLDVEDLAQAHAVVTRQVGASEPDPVDASIDDAA